MRIRIACSVLLFTFSACRNESDGVPPIDLSGTDSPATFTSSEDGAKAVAAVLGRWYTNGLLIGTAKVAQPTGYCNGGGTQTFDSDNSTSYAGDGRYESHDCLHVDVVGNIEADRIFSDGVRTLRCEDGDQCHTFTDQFGEGERPLSARYRYGDHDQLERDLQTSVGAVDDSGNFTTYTGYVQFDNLRNGKSGLLLKDGLVEGFPASGQAPGYSMAVHGAFAVSTRAAETANCLAGRMQVETIEPLSYQLYVASPQGGHLRFSSTDGTTADVVFHPDNTYDVGVNGAEPTPFMPASGVVYCTTD